MVNLEASLSSSGDNLEVDVARESTITFLDSQMTMMLNA